MSEWIEIDGSMGEGGGQVLRTSLALSLITGKSLHLYNIRSGRSKPGLQPQHLTAVRAAAAVGQAVVAGAAAGSQELSFQPGGIHPGTYHFDISTAGATSLVLQTILLPLSLADKASTVTLSGGTHVPWSPCFDYLDLQWGYFLKAMGFQFKLSMEKAGFYPQGGGSIRAVIRPASEIEPLQLTERGPLLRIQGISAVANLDEKIATRQKHQALRRLEPVCQETKIKPLNLPSPGKGTFLLLLAEFEHTQACYVSLGEKGKPAESVADEACDGLLSMLNTLAGIDEYLADQLLLPLALAQEASELRTPLLTRHLLTNADVIAQFLAVDISMDGELEQEGWVRINPVGRFRKGNSSND